MSLVLAAVFALSLFPATAAAAPDYSTIRVKLSIGDTTSLPVTLNGAYTLKESPNTDLDQKTYTVKISGTQVGLYDGSTVLFKGSSVTLLSYRISGQINTIRLKNSLYGNRDYLGDITFLPVQSGGRTEILAVNYAYLEEYLWGVVPNEMSDAFPLEALKAQAVAARGYAINQIIKTGNFDVVDTSGDQVYKGYSASATNCIKAVNATKGRVVMYNGDIIATYFSASNGGYTEVTPNIWTPTTPLPYQVVKADPYDLKNPSSMQESVTFTKGTVSDTGANALLNFLKTGYILPRLKTDGKVTQAGTPVTLISDFTLKSIDSMTGIVDPKHLRFKDYGCACTHVQEVDINVTVGTYAAAAPGMPAPQNVIYTLTIPARDFYTGGIFTKGSLSAYFLDNVKDGSGNFIGYNLRHARYGHGAGLSQRGAQQMAKEGWTYQKILAFYFPKTTLKETPYIKAPAVKKPSITAIGKVITSGADVRSNPSNGGMLLGDLAKNKIVQITKQNYSAGWHQIWYQNRLAYIKTKDVSVLAAAKAYVKTESLGMYTGASKTSSKLRTLSMGETVKVYGYSGSFALVIAHGDAGYVSKGSIIAKPPVVAAAKARSAQVTIYSSTTAGRKPLGTIKRGEMLDVIKLKYTTGWHQVWYNNRIAYVKSSAVGTLYGKKMSIKTSKAVMKTAASSSSSTVYTLVRGASVQVYSYTGNYAYINYKGLTGYVYKSALK